MFILPVCGFNSLLLSSVNLSQCVITCVTVSLTWSHEQTDEEKLDTFTLFKKTVSSMCFMWICVITELSALCSLACSLTVLQLEDFTSKRLHLGCLIVQCCFHLCISACWAVIFTLLSDLSQCSAHLILCSSSVGLSLLWCIHSLLWIRVHALIITSFMSVCLCHWQNLASLTFR